MCLVVFGLGLGLFFGLASGIATGITLAIEFSRAARGLDHYSLFWEGLFSAIRGFAFGAGLYRIVGFGFAIAFAILITVGYMVTALICSAFIHHMEHAWTFAIRVGLVTGIVTGVGATINPYIEYYADNLPERRLGVFGIGLILCGFTLQSLQYWLALFDVRLA
jgi:hypothetical protein